jgi:predicted RND superfamily exporter protein
LLDRTKRQINAGSSAPDAILAAIAVAGKPILLDGLAIALGFGVLMISRVPANARLGTLAFVAVVSCVLATLVLLPCLLAPAGRTPRSGSTPDPAARRIHGIVL